MFIVQKGGILRVLIFYFVFFCLPGFAASVDQIIPHTVCYSTVDGNLIDLNIKEEKGNIYRFYASKKMQGHQFQAMLLKIDDTVQVTLYIQSPQAFIRSQGYFFANRFDALNLQAGSLFLSCIYEENENTAASSNLNR